MTRNSRMCRWKRTIRINPHSPESTPFLVKKKKHAHSHKHNHCKKNAKRETSKRGTIWTNTSDLPPTTFPHCSHASHTSVDSSFQIQTSQLPKMVASQCTCHACRYCSNVWINIKTSCVTSIQSLFQTRQLLLHCFEACVCCLVLVA